MGCGRLSKAARVFQARQEGPRVTRNSSRSEDARAAGTSSLILGQKVGPLSHSAVRTVPVARSWHRFRQPGEDQRLSAGSREEQLGRTGRLKTQNSFERSCSACQNGSSIVDVAARFSQRRREGRFAALVFPQASTQASDDWGLGHAWYSRGAHARSGQNGLRLPAE